MILLTLAVFMFLCAVVPALLFMANLKLYKAPGPGLISPTRVAVLIPARNEEQNIAACMEHVLRSLDADLEVLILDDASTDRTAAIVREIGTTDSRVRLLSSASLPAGWNGKQHACWQLAQASAAPFLLFLDADVRLHPAAITRCLAEAQRTKVALLSGFPRQITVGFLEWMLLPLIHFVLLGFLPLARMRSTTHPADPALAAGCGQFLLAEREAYFAAGGHAAIRSTMHDGLLLPRAFRRAGFPTDLVDLTPLAEVRMYDSASKVWQGLAKNATEGIASPGRIVPISILLLLGQVVPALVAMLIAPAMLALLINAHVFGVGIHVTRPMVTTASLGIILISLCASYIPRLLAVKRFRQPLKSALLHPLGILLLLAIQWYALIRQILGKPVGWRQRAYASGTGEQVP